MTAKHGQVDGEPEVQPHRVDERRVVAADDPGAHRRDPLGMMDAKARRAGERSQRGP